nr:MAG TPA: hypothetical protein [Caudoviricetes sp.]
MLVFFSQAVSASWFQISRSLLWTSLNRRLPKFSSGIHCLLMKL